MVRKLEILQGHSRNSIVGDCKTISRGDNPSTRSSLSNETGLLPVVFYLSSSSSARLSRFVLRDTPHVRPESSRTSQFLTVILVEGQTWLRQESSGHLSLSLSLSRISNLIPVKFPCTRAERKFSCRRALGRKVRHRVAQPSQLLEISWVAFGT